MGQKSLVNRSFPFKKNLTTEVNPYIANGCRLVKGSKIQRSKVPRFSRWPIASNQMPEASDINRNTGLNLEP
jgi:hypothetical protein